MALFSSSFLLTKPGQEAASLARVEAGPRPGRVLASSRASRNTAERRTFPDPANNLEAATEAGVPPRAVSWWLARAHGNNEMSALVYR